MLHIVQEVLECVQTADSTFTEKALQDIWQDSNDLVANGKSSTHPWVCYWREIREEKAQLAKPRNAAAA